MTKNQSVKSTKRPVDKQPPYSTLPRDRLVELRVQYLADLAKPALSPTVRMAIQQELAMIRAALKVQNIAQAKLDLAAAQQRRAAGAAEHQQNIELAIAKTSTTTAGTSASEPMTLPVPSRRLAVGGGYPRGIETLGGYILMRAEQLRVAIRKIRTSKAEHTDAFIEQLDTFIDAQDAMVKIERIERGKISGALRANAMEAVPAGNDPVEWEETWKASDS